MGKSTEIAEKALGLISDKAFQTRVLREAGILGLLRPDIAARMGVTFLRWGASPATGVAVAAIHHPDATAIVDERGSITFSELHRRSNALAHAFESMGIGYGDGVGIMCRNHRGFIGRRWRRPSSAPARCT